MKKHDVNILIHGHTHRPKVHTFGNKTRIVLGDWDTGKTKYLVLENNNYELKEISL
jgi:UDP-2,3-diacylglucosamine hydrolase